MSLPPRIATAATEAGRFLSFVEVNGDCWIWDGHKKQTGYGQHCWQGRHCQAHRVSYELFNGPIVGGLHVLHTCDVRDCVNPAHLTLGTHADNMRDMMAKGRRRGPSGETAPSAVLKVADVRFILTSDETGIALARKYGVTKGAIYAIRNRKTWKAVTHAPA